MKKKVFVLCVVCISLVFCGIASAEQTDFVVLLDVSESVFPIFDDLVNYLIKDALYYQLSFGDTFHLLSFAGHTETILEQTIRNEDDIEFIVSTILLLHPLGKYTDLIGAMETLYRYVQGLPVAGDKEILILTDGIHDPPPGSANNFSQEEVSRQLAGIAENIRRQGWEVHILRLPSDGALSSETAPLFDERDNLGTLSEILDIETTEYTTEKNGEISNLTFGSPSVGFPTHLGKVNPRFKVPLTITNYQDNQLLIKLSAVMYAGENILEKPVVTVIKEHDEKIITPRITAPRSFGQGENSLDISLVFEDDLKVAPNRGVIHFYLKKTREQGRESTLSFLMTSVLIVIVVTVILVLFFIVKNILWRSSGVAGSHARVQYETATASPGKGYTPIELFVSGQNKHIGLRNVQLMSTGSKKGLGGKGSSFIIFLLDFPRNIGEITCEGETYTFYPLRYEFFPEHEGAVENCLGREITAISKKQRGIRFVFRKYVSPLEKINKIMHLTDKPGKINGCLP